MKKVEMIGLKVERWLVLEEAGKTKCGTYLYKCLCVCGNIRIVKGDSLRNGKSKSCGCLVWHGMQGTPIYESWSNMIQRCTNTNNPGYHNWGGRGISVCESWLRSFKVFHKDMGTKPKGLSLERVNNNGNYESSNCVWASRVEQGHNMRIYKNNKTGIAGVLWYEKYKKYAVRIGVNNKRPHIGYFETLEDATNARKNAEKVYWRK